MRFAVLISLVAVSAACAATPQGTVEFFLTSSSDPYGLTRPEKAFDPTGNVVNGVEYFGYDLTDLGAGVPYALQNQGVDLLTPASPVQIDPTKGEFAYVWMRMNQMSTNAKLEYMEMRWTPLVAINAASTYVLDDTGPGSTTGAARWDPATSETYYRGNPIRLSGGGISVRLRGDGPHASMLQQFYGNETNAGGDPSDDLADGLWLMSALAFNSSYRGPVTMDLVGDLIFDGMLGSDPQVPVTFVGAEIIPEPAALVLLTLGGLFMRRR